jgi:hypothetical protein
MTTGASNEWRQADENCMMMIDDNLFANRVLI